VSVEAGLALALLSAFALNWGWLAQHGAAQGLPPISLRRPVGVLRSLFGDRAWLVGFAIGLAGWVFYVASLALAPLSLVQAVSAGGIGILAALAHRGGHDIQWTAVWIAMLGLALLGVSLAGGAASGTLPAASGLAYWLAGSALVAALLVSVRFLAAGVDLGLAAGSLYAAGDVATKGAVHGGGWLALVPLILLAHGLAFVALQLGFQRGSPLATAGTSTLATNALPILAGIVLFHEHLPGGALGAVRVFSFGCVVVAAALLARQPSETTRGATSTAVPALRRNSAS
jgi:hypothetical protein